MVAAFALLDAHLAIRTISHVMFLLVFLEQFVYLWVHLLIFFARHALMTDNIAFGANRSQACGAKESLPCAGETVDLRTVWCWAVLEVFGSSSNMDVERMLEETFEIGVREHCFQLVSTENMLTISIGAEAMKRNIVLACRRCLTGEAVSAIRVFTCCV
jgi:hypothetical protein